MAGCTSYICLLSGNKKINKNRPVIPASNISAFLPDGIKLMDMNKSKQAMI